MKLNHHKQVAIVLLGLVVIFSGITYISRENVKLPSEQIQSEVVDDKTMQITLSIDGLYDQKEVSIKVGDTILKLLTDLNEADENLKLKTKSYGELGVLVESIGGMTNGTDNKYWQYSVDGVAPMVGADAYTLESGETILWEFKTSEF